MFEKNTIMKKTLILLFLITFFFSCEKNKDELKYLNPTINKARMTSANTVLRFDTYKEMYDTINKLKTLTISQIDSWESKYNFTSMRGLFLDIVDAEIAIADHMETLPSDSFPKYENMHSKLVSDYPNVTKEITMYDSLTGIQSLVNIMTLMFMIDNSLML